VTTTDLYPYLIIIGGSIIAAATWLLHQYRTQLARTQELILLNEQLGYDLPNFLRQCWPILKQCGFSGLGWELDWFGTRLAEEYGTHTPIRLDKQFEVQEIHLTLTLYRKKSGIEQQYFSSAQADNFFLLIRMNLWIKLGSVQGAFDQTARMTVFLKHDVKNMVQLLSLSSEQLLNARPGQETAILASLREALPAVQERAEHMLRALTEAPGKRPALPQAPQETLALEQVLQQTASLYDLEVQINGSATVTIERDLLLSIIDNVLGNYSRQARKEPGDTRPLLDINIDRIGGHLGGRVRTRIRDLHGRPFPWPERLFEPFWSEHGGGRGIGLYQARQHAMSVGGYLDAEASPEQPLCFTLTLPQQG
jgi:signal transduction histidine kinase